MVQRRQRERSLFEVLLPDGHKLWPDWLRKIDTLLEDEAVIEVVAQALEARWPQSRRRGRPGTPAEVVIRMLILKHLFDWSYDDLEREVRANLVYRVFTRIDAGDVPDAKTILKIARRARPGRHRAVASTGGRGREACRGHARPPISHRHHGRRNQCALSDRQHVVAGRRARADPHDATGECGVGRPAGRIRNRLRSVTRRVLIIGYQARSPKTRDAMVKSYRKLMATTRAVLRDAGDDGPAARPTRAHGRPHGAADPAARPAISCSRCGRSSQRVVAADAGAAAGRRHARPGQSPEHLRTAHRRRFARARSRSRTSSATSSPFKNRSIRSSPPTRSTRDDPRTSRCGRRRWIGIRRSSAARRISRPAIAASARRPTNRPPPTAACDAWCCRVAGRNRRRGAPTNANAGSVAGNGGASAAKGASACSNGVMDSDAVATMATTACIAGSASASSPTT